MKLSGKKKTEDDNAGVVLRPPIVYFLPLGAGLLLNYAFPLPFFPLVLSLVLGIGLVAKGLFVSGWALRTFRREGTSEKTNKPTTMIIVTGPFRFTRNPIYGGFIAIYFGVTFLANALWPVLLFPIVLVVMHYGVIKREERYLERKFGKEYLEYKSKVRRWV